MAFKSDASYGEEDYDDEASTLADVPAVGVEGTAISFPVVLAWVGILGVAVWVYRRAVLRALQTARAGNIRPRVAFVHVRSAFKACAATARRRFAVTWSALLTKPSDDVEDPHAPRASAESAATVSPGPTVVVDPPETVVTDASWVQSWDVSPRLSEDAKETRREALRKRRDETPPETMLAPVAPTEDAKEEAAAAPLSGVFPGRAAIHPDAILRNESHIRWLCETLPRAQTFDAWNLLYHTSRDGFSLNTLYRKCDPLSPEANRSGPIVTLVRDDAGGVFGAFTSEPWRVRAKSYGDGRSFVFRALPEEKREVYRWVQPEPSSRELGSLPSVSGGKTGNYAFQMGHLRSLSLGGGSGFALWLDGDLLNGTSAACETFGTPGPLSTREEFKIRAVEVWGFEAMRRSVDVAGTQKAILKRAT